ncbi:MAG: ABC transporter ATP-binding protein [Gemmatimonadaceae bacterium]|nr:ABC transporter ATP-binding protein [Gemmatimonadaceae bacterium]
MTTPLLSVRDLRVEFATPEGAARAVDGVSFDLERGETLGIVGESGSGKSVTASALLGLIDPPGRITAGSICFGDRELVGLSERDWGTLRGQKLALVFQEPSAALTPVLTIGDQIAEIARVHRGSSAAEARAAAITMLGRVGIPDPAARAEQYPHELSGGMRQRVLLAMALLLEPDILVADEPTTALDVTVQAQLLDLLRDLREATGLSIVLITHDLGVIADIADRMLVMYAGEVVEEGRVADVFRDPRHPYTAGLLAARPRVDAAQDALRAIPGSVPAATAWPRGCRFAERCASAWDRCVREAPAMSPRPDGGSVRCHLESEPDRRVGAATHGAAGVPPGV